MRRFLLTAGAAVALDGVSVTGALAADPGTQGQPGESCQARVVAGRETTLPGSRQ
jgi:hypothetical protein